MEIYVDRHGKAWKTTLLKISKAAKKRSLLNLSLWLKDRVPVRTGRLRDSIEPDYARRSLRMVYYGPEVIRRRGLMVQLRMERVYNF